MARTLRLVALGDSLTAGLWLPPGKAFPDRLEAALRAKGWNVEVINAGVSGDTAAGLSRLGSAQRRRRPHYRLGANDTLRGMNPRGRRRHWRRNCRQGPCRPFPLLGHVAAPNLGGEHTSEFSPVYSAFAKSYDVSLYSFFLDGVAGDPKLDQPDGLHPNAQGVPSQQLSLRSRRS